MLKKRENNGLLAGLYEFYKQEGHCSEKEALEAVESLGLRPIRIKALGEAKHIFTHKEWEMIGYEVYCGDFQEEGWEEKQGYRFYTKEEIQGELSIPSAFAYYKQFL